jgi:uncharacterized protein (TIGR03435 family)
VEGKLLDHTFGVLMRTLILLIAAVSALLGQSGGTPQFQSVSIKRNTSNWNERFQHPMGMGANASLRLLIQFAYAPHDSPHWLPLPASQVVGGPAWIDSEGFDIDTKPANPDPKQQWLMWQNLLADRFQLKLHRETRELPVYIMSAAPGGLQLPPAKNVVCVEFAPGTRPRPVPGKVDCGYVAGPIGGYTAGLLHIEGSKVRMAGLVRELALILDRPILDRTGFTGEFDLNLSFAADDSIKAMPRQKQPSDPNLPNLLTALEQQLGLKLVPAKAPVEVLVVDHAERPATN